MDFDVLKSDFVTRTNTPRTRERARRAALTAASQHNLLYAAGLGWQDRSEVRTHWMSRLDELASRYTKFVSERAYLEDVASLCADMNRRFADRFGSGNHPRYQYAAGFRVSHGQKSLSVYLKHLWCLGDIPTPPQCPVDSIVLRRAGLTYPQTRWAYVNSIEEHKRQIGLLKQKAKEVGLSLAEWELAAW